MNLDPLCKAIAQCQNELAELKLELARDRERVEALREYIDQMTPTLEDFFPYLFDKPEEPEES